MESNACELFKIAKIISKKINVNAPSPETLIMIEIEKNGKMSASELASIFLVTIPAIMHKVDDMITDGLMIKTVNDTDKRTKYFEITDKARKLLEDNKKQIDNNVDSMFNNLTPEEKKEFFRLLNKLIDKEE